MYTQYFDILSDNEYNFCKKIIDNSKWRYGHSSNGINGIGNKFWKIDGLHNESFFIDVFVPKIEKLTGNIFKIQRIYANGHTFGQGGDWHTDSIGENDWTFLYYFNKGDSSLIGETYFKDNNDTITNICVPTFNSGIFFRANIQHKGTPPKLEFNDLRITIAFKLTMINSKNTKTLF